MLQFNHKKFFDGYRARYGALSPQQVKGLERLLTRIEADPYVTLIPEAAYMLATVKHETADTFTPIHEYGSKSYFIKRYGSTTKVGKTLGNDTPEEGYYYAGKGDVQLTGEGNYEKAEIALRAQYPDIVADFELRTGKTFDLTVGDQPGDTGDSQNVLDPAISYAIMSYGMRTGMFTGKKLSTYITAKKQDYAGARKIINGVDKKDLIAGYAEMFEKLLNSAVATKAVQPKVTEETQAELPQVGELATPELIESGVAAGIPAPPPTLVPVVTPVVEVEQVTAAKDEPKEEPKEDTLTKIGNRLNAVYTAAGTAVAGVIAWFASSPAHIVLGIMAAVVLLGIAYMIINALRQAKKEKNDREINLENARLDTQLKLQREKQAFELQKITLESAMNKELNTVRIVPPPSIIPNSDVVE